MSGMLLSKLSKETPNRAELRIVPNGECTETVKPT